MGQTFIVQRQLEELVDCVARIRAQPANERQPQPHLVFFQQTRKELVRRQRIGTAKPVTQLGQYSRILPVGRGLALQRLP